MSLHVALIEPEIPPNTGNIARLCAAAGAALHLVEPLGFSLADRDLRRAGVDCWDAVELWIHPGWSAFHTTIAPDRRLYFSAQGTRPFWSAPYRTNTVLVFGRESTGLPVRVRQQYADRLYRIPTTGTVRSLNLATAVGIVLYEAIRRLHLLGAD